MGDAREYSFTHDAAFPGEKPHSSVVLQLMARSAMLVPRIDRVDAVQPLHELREVRPGRAHPQVQMVVMLSGYSIRHSRKV